MYFCTIAVHFCVEKSLKLPISYFQDAVEAVKATNNYKLDKSHYFTVNLFSDFEKYENIEEEWEPPKEEPYGDQGNRKSFLLNENAHDQYAVVFNGGEKVNIILILSHFQKLC